MSVGPGDTCGYCRYGPDYPTYVTHQVPAYFLRLVFDPAGTLQEWKKLAR